MKKVLSIVLALVLIVLSLSCMAMAAITMPGDVNEDGKVAATDARMILQVVAGLEDESFLKNWDNADLVADGKIKATDARKILQIVAGLEETPSTPSQPSETPTFPQASDKAGWASLINSETAKAAKGTYNWERVCEYTKELSVSSGLTGAVKPTVDKLLGVGTSNGTNKDADKYGIIPMGLTASDIKSVKQTANSVTLVLNDATNPTADGNTAINHVSNDFVTLADVNNVIADSGLDATVTNFKADYKNIEITAVVDSNGKPVSLTISYELSAHLEAKYLVVKPVGDGTVKTVIKYTNLNY